MVLISHKYKFIYIKNKKVAGSSVESFFGQFCIDPKKKYEFTDKIDLHIDNYGIIGSRLKGSKKFKNCNQQWKPHKTAKSIKNDIGDTIFNKYLKFCVVRNPYDKLVSGYYYDCSKKNKIPTITDFKRRLKIRQGGRLNNLKFIHSEDGKNSVCDFFIRFEHLEEDIIKLCKILNIKKYNISDLPRHKSTFRNDKLHYSKFYDEEAISIVKKKFENELKLFGYDFKSE